MVHGLRRRNVLLLGVVALAGLVFLTGCIGTGDAVEEPLAVKDRPASPDDGAVLGVVAALDGTPLSRFDVTIPEYDLEARIFDDGSYLFYPLAPGEYTVVVESATYVPATETVTVHRGEDVYLDFVLNPTALPDPWREISEKAGYIECSAEVGWDLEDEAGPTMGTVDQTVYETTGQDPNTRGTLARSYVGHVLCGTVDVFMPNTTNHRSIHKFHLGPDIQTLLVETDWDPTSSMSEKLTVRMEVQGFANQHPGTFYRVQEEPPVVKRYGPIAWRWMENAFDVECMKGQESYCGHQFLRDGFPLQLRVFPTWDCVDQDAGGCVVTGQTFTHYVGAYFGRPAPPGWTLHEGA